MNSPVPKIPKIAYTATGTIANVLHAAEVINQQATEPVDLWILQANPKLHKQLETKKHIRRVFVSPVRDRDFSNPDHNTRAIPVYGRYNDVVHFGKSGRFADSDSSKRN